MAKSYYVKASTEISEDRAWKLIAQMTPNEVEDSLQWYGYARAQCEQAAKDLGIGLRLFVHIVAAISPGRDWNENVNDATMLVVWHQHGGNWRDLGKRVKFAVSYSYAGIKQAWRMLTTGKAEHLTGPKVEPFAASILDDSHGVATVDYHMVKSGNGELKGVGFTFGPAIRRKVQAMVETVALWFGVSVAQAQALIWQAQKTYGSA